MFDWTMRRQGLCSSGCRSAPFGAVAAGHACLLMLTALVLAGSAWAESHPIAVFPIPNNPNAPRGITTGPDGNLWFVEEDNGIGRITPSGQITEFPLPQPSYPSAITTGSDGNLWFTQGRPARISKMTPAGQVTEFQLPEGTLKNRDRPAGITAGPDGNIWFTQASNREGTAGSIGRITPSGQITEFPVLGESAPGEIATGPDGNLWFSGSLNLIGRITPGGQIVKFTLPSEGWPAYGITAGPDGNLWYTGGRWQSGMIGRVPTDLLGVEFKGRSVGFVRHRWTTLDLACIGGSPARACSGIVRLSAQVKRRHHGRRSKTVIVAQRHYKLPSETSRRIALRLRHPALLLLARRRRLQVEGVATTQDGQEASREIALRAHRQRMHRRGKAR